MAAQRTAMPDWFESRSFTISVLLHLLIVLFAAFGLPALLPKTPEPVPMVMTVEVLPISAMTNLKPSDQPISEKKEAAAQAKNPAPPPPPKQMEQPKLVEQPKPKEEPKPTEKPVEKHFDPNEGAEPKPAEKKEESKPQTEKVEAKKQEDDFLKTLNNLKAEAQKTEKKAPDATTQPENKTKSDAPYDESMPLSLGEKDAIRNQFIPCWSPPMGAKDAANLVVILKAQFKETGELIDVQMRPDMSSRYGSDPFFRAAVDSAIRAVHRCAPLKNLDMAKYGSWKDMELTFDPKLYF